PPSLVLARCLGRRPSSQSMSRGLSATRSPARVLILTASVGEGHDLPARTLAAQLLGEAPETDVVISDGLAPMGRFIEAVSASAPRVIFYRGQWIWDAAFWVVA